jgi:hypothetical protein
MFEQSAVLCLCARPDVCLLAAGIVVQVEVGCPSLQTVSFAVQRLPFVRGEQNAYFCPGSGRQLEHLEPHPQSGPQRDLRCSG